MYELKKKLERYWRVNLLGPGPRLMEKRIYRAAVSQSLRNTDLEHPSLHQAHSSDSRIPLTTELTPFITYNTTHDYKDSLTFWNSTRYSTDTS